MKNLLTSNSSSGVSIGCFGVDSGYAAGNVCIAPDPVHADGTEPGAGNSHNDDALHQTGCRVFFFKTSPWNSANPFQSDYRRFVVVPDLFYYDAAVAGD